MLFKLKVNKAAYVSGLKPIYRLLQLRFRILVVLSVFLICKGNGARVLYYYQLLLALPRKGRHYYTGIPIIHLFS